MRALPILGIAVLLGACSRDVAVMSAPNLNVYTSYTDKVPGKWLLSVESSTLHQNVHTDGIACAAYSWPIDMNEAFRQSARATFANLADSVELVQGNVPAEGLAQGGYSGVIHVNTDDFRVHL